MAITNLGFHFAAQAQNVKTADTAVRKRTNIAMAMKHDHNNAEDYSLNIIKPDNITINGTHLMTNSQSKNLPMSRNGSGTGWLPDASPVYGLALQGGNWSYMLHGNIDIRYTNKICLKREHEAIAGLTHLTGSWEWRSGEQVKMVLSTSI